MPKKRKEGATNTTIAVTWADKNRLRRLAKVTKTTKNGDVYEPDYVLFNKVLQYYMDHNPSEVKNVTTSTYPQRSQDERQQD